MMTMNLPFIQPERFLIKRMLDWIAMDDVETKILEFCMKITKLG